MNEIINKFLLVGDKFMPEIHSRQPGLTYSACGSFTKNKERIKKFMQSGNTDFICKNELNQIKFKEIKHLKLLVIQNMMVIKED